MAATAWTQPAAIPAEDFAANPQIESVRVSPDNEQVAMIIRQAQGTAALAVKSLLDNSPPRLLVHYGNVDVASVRWVSNKRLMYYVQAPGARIYYDEWGTFAVDADGSHEEQLISARSDNLSTGTAIKARALPRGWAVWGIPESGDDIIVGQRHRTLERGYTVTSLSRLNTRTMQLTPLTEGQPEHASAWQFDSQGRLRVVVSISQGRSKLWWRGPALGAWQLLEDAPFGPGQGTTVPVALEADDTLIVQSRVGSDFEGLYVYDVAKRKVEPDPLVSVKGFDIGDGNELFDRSAGRLLGVHLRTDSVLTVWFDDTLQNLQRTVDQALPGRSNQLLCGRCVGAQQMVVRSSNDTQPAEFHVLDVKARRLRLLGQSRPWIKPEQQGHRSFHRVAARDGLSLPVVVTHPAGAKDGQALPTVLLVHGGPWVRGTYTGWSSEPQFLASRGYRVLEVDFRGSTGLGWNHYHAGWRQWGLAMQDDLEDALLWAVKQGLSDASRVCIYGGSYGGYAALMGLVRHPTRYRCAVSHVGVTDIRLLFSGNWTDIVPLLREYNLNTLVGDPERDADRLKQASPVERVGDIKAPILLVQGRLDARVHPVHADRFESAARRAGVNVERRDFEEGHGWASPANHAEFLTLLESFFNKHIGPAAKP